eukprot:351475-Chlamydomonas_euryale.AAC.2
MGAFQAHATGHPHPCGMQSATARSTLPFFQAFPHIPTHSHTCSAPRPAARKPAALEQPNAAALSDKNVARVAIGLPLQGGKARYGRGVDEVWTRGRLVDEGGDFGLDAPGEAVRCLVGPP